MTPFAPNASTRPAAPRRRTPARTGPAALAAVALAALLGTALIAADSGYSGRSSRSRSGSGYSRSSTPPATSAPATTAPALAAPPKYDYRERYAVVYERNIFMRDRPRVRTDSGASTQREFAPRPPEASYVLTGTVLEEGQFRAYVENLAAGSIVRLSPGEAIARGRVVAIDIDGILYDHEGRQTWVDLGKDLSGATVVPGYAGGTPLTAGATGFGTTRPGPTTGPSPGPLPNPDDPSLSLAERMRLRRQAELNKK